MSMSLEQIMEFARQQWGEGLEPSQGNIHEAAVGLVSNWYRNTNAVETLAHAEGPWSDEDMLRKNAWATEPARLAITAVAERVDDLAAVQARRPQSHAADRRVEVRPSVREARGSCPRD